MIRKYEILKSLVDEYGIGGFVVCRVTKIYPKQQILNLKHEGFLMFCGTFGNSAKYNIYGAEFNSHIAFITIDGLEKLHNLFPQDKKMNEYIAKKATIALSRIK